ncbi:MAG: chemotaxis protein CheX [Candidatus Sulfopaludibacter sp.]|nr:chemotaxis protein CheX [Candidatus Sulfopaludibacter sp.]
MSDSLQFVLQQSVEDVLEKMFFIRSLDDALEEPGLPEGDVKAHLTFDGEPSGFLTLRVTREAARSISADFLGAEEGDLNEQQVGEVVCELANMICGSVLSRFESAVTFRLAQPELGEGDEHAEPASGTAGLRALHCVEIGGGNLTVAIHTEPLALRHGAAGAGAA